MMSVSACNGDYQAINVQEYKPGFFEFDLKEWSKVTGHIRLAVPGRHNIYNALAMCAVCRFAGLTVEQHAPGCLAELGPRGRLSLAVLALAAGLELSIDDAEAVQKSWPHFFEAIKPLGAEVEYAG